LIVSGKQMQEAFSIAKLVEVLFRYQKTLRLFITLKSKKVQSQKLEFYATSQIYVFRWIS
jgi:hypothetical protein